MLFVVGCSTTKDAFLNRSYHGVSTKFNVLYNGKEALRIGLQELNANYEDNYWDRLPIEPLKVDKMLSPGMSPDTDNSPKEFERAEEKAVKAIQKHSMVIARQERNKQIDDGYLLLGKARYYSKRFVPALEAFNFVILNYPNANLINETKIWQSKTYLRLQNEEQAVENLKLLLKEESLDDDIKEEAHTAIAMAYTQLGETQQVINHLNKAVVTDKNKEQTARNLFILGQIYREQKFIDSSNISFQKIIDMKKALFKYKIHAQIEKAKNITTKEDAVNTIAELIKLVKDRDNRPYLDELYYHLGLIETSQNTKMAIEYFKKSLQATTSRNFQKELTYEAIGNLHFDKAEFLEAGSYYDSILQITNDVNTKRVRRLIRKRNNLNEVILYENIAKTNDSIIDIVAMNKEERIDFFTRYIEKLKAEEEQQQQISNTGSGLLNSGKTNKREDTKSGKWYFYNVQAVGFGEQEFKRVWGNRPLEDNWRLSDKTQLNLRSIGPSTTQTNFQIDNSKKHEISYYLDNIPAEKSKIDTIKNERNNAYYKLGLIYKEQFKEVDLAISKLEKLLTFNPDSEISLPAKYHLYKIYSNQKSEKAISLKNDIITNYTNSKYAKIILNPSEVINEANNNLPENEYATIFYEYKGDKFESVIEKSTIAINKFEGQAIVPKFELLKAYAIGKKEGLVAFKQALDFVAINYPNTEEGKKALEVIATLKSKI